MSKLKGFPTLTETKILRLLASYNGTTTSTMQVEANEWGISDAYHSLDKLYKKGLVIRNDLVPGKKYEGFFWACSPKGLLLVQVAKDLKIGEL